MKRLHLKRKAPKVRRVTYDESGRNVDYVRCNVEKKESKEEEEIERTVSSLNSVHNNEPTEEISTSHISSKTCNSSSKRGKLTDAWESIRNSLIQANTEEMAPASFYCIKCSCYTSSIIQCKDCSAVAYYCESCCVNIHETVLFHTPNIWKGSYYVPFKNKNIVSLKRQGHDCNSAYNKELCMIDMKGVQHKVLMEFCKCEKEAVTVIRYGMWPASPDIPKVIFQRELVELATVLQIESQLSIKSFCDALKSINRYQIYDFKEVKDVYRILVGDCANEYRYHRTIFGNGMHTVENLDFAKCPACSENSAPYVTCVDANFGLVHKKSSGSQGLEFRRHKDASFFYNQEEVDTFVDNYKSNKQTEECSRFQAGNILRSKIKNSKLDVTGVFGSVCKHDFPLRFCNMRYGERLAYPVYFLKDLNEQLTENKKLFMYDIACVLHKHLLKNNMNDLLKNTKLVVPVFHSFAHNMKCQIIYGQKNVESCGLADGEGTERLWAYLRKFSKITKEMSLCNRHDLLVDALHHYATRLQSKLFDRIVSRHQKALMLKDSSKKLLENENFQDEELLDQLQKWCEERVNLAKASTSKEGLEATLQEEYSWLLYQSMKMRNQIESDNTTESCKDKLSKELESTEKKLVKLEKKAGISQRWELEDCGSLSELYKVKLLKKMKQQMKIHAIEKSYLLSMMKKYADGQDVSLRIGKQMQSVSTKLSSSLKEYNETAERNFSLKDVSVSTATFYDDVDTIYLSPEKMKAVEAYTTLQRAEEEISQSLIDMNNTISWVVKQEQIITSKISYLQNCEISSSRSAKGQICLLIFLKMKFENLHIQASERFSKFINVDDFEVPVISSILQHMQVDKFEPSISSEDLDDALELIQAFEEREQENGDDDDDLSDDDL